MIAGGTFLRNTLQRSDERDAGDHAFISLNAASPDEEVALCSGLDLGADKVPEWVHLLPAGTVTTRDSRGPYKVGDAEKLAAHSIAVAGGRLPIDENHSTDLKGPIGEPSPARGWIVALQARADGIWGQVEWTTAGRALVEDRAYRFISPVLMHLKDGTVTRLLRAALVNTPNIPALAALNSEKDTPMLAKLLAALGLKEDADETTALNAIMSLKTSVSLNAIAIAAGLKEGTEEKAIVARVGELAAAANNTSDDKKTITALQGEVTELGTRLKSLQDSTSRKAAEQVVDAAINAGKPGVKPLRDHFITRHMADPNAVEKELAALPSLTVKTPAGERQPTDKDGKITLNAEQENVAKLLGIKPEAMQATLAAEAAGG